MALSYIIYTGDGSQTDYTFPFSYLDKSDIYVTVDLVTVPFTFITSSSIRCTTPPISGGSVKIKRSTQTVSPPVNFTDGSVLLEKDLDTLVNYTLYLAQEQADSVGESLSDYGTLSDSIAYASTIADSAAASAAIAQAAADAALLSTSTGPVVSVNGHYGVVALTKDDISLGAVENAAASTLYATKGINTDITSITGNAATATVAAACSGNSVSASNVAWSGVSGKPTTVAGYGITNMASQSVNYATTAGNGGVTSVNGLTGAVTIPTTTLTTSQVLNATAGATVGAVGSYAFLYRPSSVVAGTNYTTVYYAGLVGYGTNNVYYTTGAAAAGTWKAMGTANDPSYSPSFTLFLRVA